MLHARVIRQYRIPAPAITKQSHDRRMGAPHHAYDAAFRALRLPGAGHPLHFHQYRVAMHRIFDRIARNEDVTIEPLHRRIRHHKSVPVVMQNQPALDLVVTKAAALRRSPPLPSRLRPAARRRLARPVAAPPVFAASQPVPS